MDISTEYLRALDGAKKKKVKLKDDIVKNLLVKYINDNNNIVDVFSPLSYLLGLPKNNNIAIHWMDADCKGNISPTRLYLFNLNDDYGRGRRNRNKNTMSSSA